MNHPSKVRSLGVHSRRGGDWLQPLCGDWPSAACRALEVEPAVVRVVIAAVKGSAPREPGTCMLVGAIDTLGTIGGGHLEWQAVRLAREALAAERSAAGTQRFVLGTELGQCCGGVVELWLERLTRRDLPLLRSAAQAAHDGEPVLMSTALAAGSVTRRVVRAATPAFLPPALRPWADALLARDAHHRVFLASASAHAGNTLGEPINGSGALGRGQAGNDVTLLERLDCVGQSLWLYGAGHVGQALVRILAELPIDVTWVDSRAGQLPRSLPDNVRALPTLTPVSVASTAPRGACHLVMTHDHALDYALCHAILLRNDFGWLGLIGSASKGAKFRSRLRREGVSPEDIAQLVCPIGVEGVEGKAPSVIAISVAAQLLQAISSTADSVSTSDARDVHPETLASSTNQQVAGECSPDQCASCGSAGRTHA